MSSKVGEGSVSDGNQLKGQCQSEMGNQRKLRQEPNKNKSKNKGQNPAPEPELKESFMAMMTNPFNGDRGDDGDVNGDELEPGARPRHSRGTHILNTALHMSRLCLSIHRSWLISGFKLETLRNIF